MADLTLKIMGRLTEMLQLLGRYGLRTFGRLGRAQAFLLHLCVVLPGAIRRPRDVVQMLYVVGFLSLLIIVVSGFFVGMVLGLQGYNTLVDFGAEESLGVLVSLSLVRELGPVVTALLFAGRAGSALTAEIGLMKTTEQLAAIEMMAVDPVRRVVAPRFIAGVVSMPLLAAVFSLAGIYGGSFVGVALLGVDSGSFWSQMQSAVALWEDLFNGIIKSIVFGFIVTWIAVYEGYETEPTSAGISLATTRTVVNSSLAVLGTDFVLTALMFN